MNHTRRTKSILAGRISALSPIIAALALSWTGAQAHAALSDADAQAALANQLTGFSAEEVTGAPKVYAFPTLAVPNPKNSVITAPANDLVYAVYRIVGNGQGAIVTSVDDIATVVKAALSPVNGKSRTDINTVAARVLNAAIVGEELNGVAKIDFSADTTGAELVEVLNAAATASGAKLTTAGKEALVAQALKVADPDTAAGAAIAADISGTGANAAFSALTASDTQKEAFAVAALKKVGTATSQVQGFSQQLLSNVSAATLNTVGLKIATGVASTPVIAGDVIGGLVAQIKATATDSTASDTAIDALLNKVLTTAALAKDVTYAVAKSLPSYSGATPLLTKAATLVSALPAAKETPTIKAAVLGGYLATLGTTPSASDVSTAVTTIDVIGKPLTAAQLASFAGAASTAAPDAAGGIILALSGQGLFAKPTNSTAQKTEDTAFTAVAVAQLKAIAATASVDAIDSLVSSTLTAGTTNGYTAFTETSGDTLKLALAVSLAKAAPTNAVTTSEVVDAVYQQYTAKTEAALDTLATKALAAAPKSAVNIVKLLAVEAAALSTPVSAADFALHLVNDTGTGTDKFPAGSAASVAAGAALADPTHIGEVAVAVINANATQQAKAVAIATAVAASANIEDIAKLGFSVASDLPAVKNGNGKVPAFTTTIASLATALGKAINAKTQEQTSNRVDELGELAAELTQAAIAKDPAGTTVATEATFQAIGTALFKSLSATLQENGGPFPADLKDAAEYITGSILQTISTSGLPAAEIAALLSSSGALEKALLAAAAKAFPKGTVSGVTTGFNNVNGGINIYETSTVNDPETTITSS